MTLSSNRQLESDYLEAWTAAVNLVHHTCDSAASRVSMGGGGEVRRVSHREWLLDLYMRVLLVHVDGDRARLIAVAAEARRRRDVTTSSETGADVAVEALAHGAAWIARRAGAETDVKARKSLVAATRYQTRREIAGEFLGDPALAGGPERLIDELDRIANQS